MDGQIPNFQELLNNLKHQLSLYSKLVDLLRDEKEFLIQAKSKEFRECTYSKEAVLDEIHREEFRRLRWMGIAKQALTISEDLTIELLASKYSEKEMSESLKSIKVALIHVIKKAREMNQDNSRLIGTALKDIQEMKKGVLGLSSDRPNVYGPKGTMGDSTREQGARFLSEEV